MTTGNPAIVILGSTGTQGCAALATLKDSEPSATILALTRSSERHVTMLRDSDARSKSAICDPSDVAGIAANLGPGDILLNAAAPFFRFGNAAARACIAAGAHYADICDDWEATASILALDAEAQQAGVSLVTGFGSAPGLSNMLALAAMSGADFVSGILTGWALAGGSGGAAPQTSTPYVHLVQCCVGPIRMLVDAVEGDDEPLQPVQFRFPGRGKLTGWTIGSPEAVTLHRGRPGVLINRNLMLTADATAALLSGMANTVRSGALGLDAAGALLAAAEPSRPEAPPALRLFALADLERAGERFLVGAELVGWHGSYDAAGRILGIVPSLARGGLFDRAGAFSVEDVLTPPAYLIAASRSVMGPDAPVATIRTVLERLDPETPLFG